MDLYVMDNKKIMFVWNLLQLNLTLQLSTFFFMHWVSLWCLSGLTAFENECVLYSHSGTKLPDVLAVKPAQAFSLGHVIVIYLCFLNFFTGTSKTIFRFAFHPFFTANIVPCSVKICRYYYHYCLFYFHLSFRKIKELTLHGATPISDVQGVKSFLSLFPHTPNNPLLADPVMAAFAVGQLCLGWSKTGWVSPCPKLILLI